MVVPLIPALGRQRQVDLCEFEASLVYGASSGMGSRATEKPCLRGKKKFEQIFIVIHAQAMPGVGPAHPLALYHSTL